MNKIISKEIFKKIKLNLQNILFLKKETYNKIKLNIILKKKNKIFL